MFKKILVFNPSFIGDSILTTPLLKALRKLYPDAELVFCVRPESAPVLQSESWRILTYDKRGSERGFAGFKAFLAKLKAENFDLAISPHKSLRSTLLIKAAAPYRIGYKNAALSFLYTKTLRRDMNLHEVERIMALLMPLNSSIQPESLYTYKHNTYAETSKNYMKNAANGAKLAGINAGSVWATKRWPVEYFAELAEKLHAKGYAIAIFGGPGDEAINEELRKLIDFEYFDYADKTSFDKIPALIGNMDVFITNDSAPLHIAASQNTPVVAIFGATVPQMGFAPWQARAEICEVKELPCRPCGKHGGHSCPQGHFKCMKDLSVETVLNATLRLA